MTFRRPDLQEAFFVPGTQPFRVYGYGTTDPLEEVLRQDYFAAARALLRPGELICVSAAAPRLDVGGSARGEARLALVMVRGPGAEPRAGRRLGALGSLGPTTKVGPEQRGCRTSAARAIRRARPARRRHRCRMPRRCRPGAGGAARPAAGPRNRRDAQPWP